MPESLNTNFSPKQPPTSAPLRSTVRSVMAVAAVATLSLSSACNTNGYQRMPPLGPDGYSSLVYVAAGAGASRLQPEVEGAEDVVLSRDKAAAGSLTLGIDTSQRTSVELQLAHLGEAELNTGASVTYRTGSVMLAGRWFEQRSGFNLYGKLGVGSLQSSDSNRPGVNVVTNNNFNLVTGVGVEYLSRNGMGMRFEYVGHDTDAQYAGLNFLYHFGASSNSRSPDRTVFGDAGSRETESPSLVETTETQTTSATQTPVPTAPEPVAVTQVPAESEPVALVEPEPTQPSEPLVRAPEPAPTPTPIQPEVVRPEVTQPRVTQPEVTQPEVTEPVLPPTSVAQSSPTTDRPIIRPVIKPTPPTTVVAEEPPEVVVVEPTRTAPSESMNWDIEVTENTAEFVESPSELTPPREVPAPSTPVVVADSDTDADGVPDQQDDCATSPDGVPVNDSGCERYSGLLDGVGFVEASSSLSAASLRRLDQVANDIKNYPELELEFQVQAAGNKEDAQLLARRRTLEVFRYLRAQGVSAVRLRALPPAIGAGASAEDPGVIMRRKTTF